MFETTIFITLWLLVMSAPGFTISFLVFRRSTWSRDTGQALAIITAVSTALVLVAMPFLGIDRLLLQHLLSPINLIFFYLVTGFSILAGMRLGARGRKSSR